MTFSRIKTAKIFALLTSCLAVMGLLFSLFQVQLSAQNRDTGKGLILSPAIMELDSEKGTSHRFTVKLENDSDNDNLAITSLVNTFEGTEEEGIPNLKELPEGSALRNWINFDQQDFTVRSRESFDSNFTVNIPSQAEAGSYFLAITYSTTGNGGLPNQNSGVQITRQVAALLFVNVKGKVNKKVEFTQFQTNKRIYDPFFDGIKLDYKIKTSGNSYLKPAGNIFFASGNTEEYSLPLNADGKFILPNSSRSFSLSNQPSFNLPLLTQAVNEGKDVDIQRSWFGSKDIKGTVLFANGDEELQTAEVQIEIFFFPWKTILALIFLLSLGTIIYISVRQATRKQA